MNREILKQLVNLDNRFNLAILTLGEIFATIGDGDISSVYGDIGITITKDHLVLINLDTGEIILALRKEI